MRAFIISATLVFSGCVSNNILPSSSGANLNVSRMHELSVGMTQDQVFEIMRYPMKEDQITTAEGRYDIWYYLTKSTILGQNEEVERNLTPLVFKDGIFIGKGYSFVRKAQASAKTAPSKTEPAPPGENEDIEIEKSLEESETPAATVPSGVKPNGKAPTTPAAPETSPSVKPNGSVPSPAAPVKKATKNKRPNQSLSMSSKPKQPKAPEEETAPKSDEDSKTKLDEKDREMLDREQEENFNDW
jgi:outer membrane protein assembly factor BamE (lipoprotein component of BamABCDE complex)